MRPECILNASPFVYYLRRDSSTTASGQLSSSHIFFFEIVCDFGRDKKFVRGFVVAMGHMAPSGRRGAVNCTRLLPRSSYNWSPSWPFFRLATDEGWEPQIHFVRRNWNRSVSKPKIPILEQNDPLEPNDPTTFPSLSQVTPSPSHA